MAKGKRKVLLLIDGNNYCARAYFATPPLSSASGVRTNAIKGFINILLADIYMLRPTHVAVTFDKGGKPNWRAELYPEYKSGRKKYVEKTDKKSMKLKADWKSIREQTPLLQDILRSMGLRIVQKAGVEADDLIGTLSTEYHSMGFDVIIGTSDKDMMQLVRPGIRVMRPDRTLFTEREVRGKFGVSPSQIVDFLAICGDGADSVPGIAGLGPGKAKMLLNTYGTLRSAIKNREDTTPSVCKALAASRKTSRLSQTLITIKCDERHKVKPSQLVFPNDDRYDLAELSSLCRELNLKQTYSAVKKVLTTWKPA